MGKQDYFHHKVSSFHFKGRQATQTSCSSIQLLVSWLGTIPLPGNAVGTTGPQPPPPRELTGEGLKTPPSLNRQDGEEPPNGALPRCLCGPGVWTLFPSNSLTPPTHFLSFYCLFIFSTQPFQLKWLSNSRCLPVFITGQFPFQGATQSNCRVHP